MANAQHKGWDDPVLEVVMAAPGNVPEVVDAGAQKLAVGKGVDGVDECSRHRME